MPPLDEKAARRQRIIAGLQGRGLEQALTDRALWDDMKAEADSDDPNKLVSPDLIRLVEGVRDVRKQKAPFGLFLSTDDVIIVPGFMGSELSDVSGGALIWVDPALVVNADKLLDLGLGPFQDGRPDTDATAGVTIRAGGAVPLIYSGLKLDLEVRRYEVKIFGFDWRKDIEESARLLAGLIQERANRRFRPLHLIAHSQGTIVARRALQQVGEDLARRLVNNLVLLGPATAGTFSAAFAIAGSHEMIEAIRRYHIVDVPPGFTQVLQSMTGLYQLLPWRTEPADYAHSDHLEDGRDQQQRLVLEDRPPGLLQERDPLEGDPALSWVKAHRPDLKDPGFWKSGVDCGRLKAQYGWGHFVDATFLNDRTTIILGDLGDHSTVGGVKFVGNKLVSDSDFTAPGDGTVPESMALIAGVTRVFKARGAEHMMLPATLSVIAAVRDLLAGRSPKLEEVPAAAAEAVRPLFLAEPREPIAVPQPSPNAVRQQKWLDEAEAKAAPPAKAKAKAAAAAPVNPAQIPAAPEVPPPVERRLRVFSFDPLFATELDALGTEQITLRLPWNFADGDNLQPGPVGEYLEVVDYDPASRCFYPPVDLNHEHLLARDGVPLSEGEPQFHQQMTYAVAMNTIRQFEEALGRVALWAPHLSRDHAPGAAPSRLDDEFVQRLRVYPHALRQANAYYDPKTKALLFGYFRAEGADVGRNLPGGIVFACLSYDIIAHETTHALLDGLHPYLIEPSNPDVFAFHEAFADVVALFQHFSHPEVLWYQLARTRGDVAGEGMLGVLAAQFGEALGNRGALRSYLGKWDEKEQKWKAIKPDSSAIQTEREPHARGAILVAALFRAFANIYENRVKDLRRIATNGSGVLPNGDLHPDLITRLADEAAKSARHMLTMCIRALDYIPPVDLTFGEYLRALITADYDLVHDDDRCYRVSVVSAFRDWGIYPGDVRSLSVDSLLWDPLEMDVIDHPKEFFEEAQLEGWQLDSKRRDAYSQMRLYQGKFHDELKKYVLKKHVKDKYDYFLGLYLERDPSRGASIRRGKDGLPIFEVHSLRPCRRVGPDGQVKKDAVIEIVQKRLGFFDPDYQRDVDQGKIPYEEAKLKADFEFRGGCTLIIDQDSGKIRYCIYKPIFKDHGERLEQERLFRQGDFGDKVGGIYLSDDNSGNPFAFLHGAR